MSSPEIDPRFLQLAKRILPPAPIICDIGSRDALEGMHLLRELNGAHLHVFEANPAAAEKCRANINSGNVTLNQVAVTNRNGTVSFYPVDADASDNKDIGFSSLLKLNPAYTKRRGTIVQDEIKVEAVSLDTYFAHRPPPHLLWVDVEGAELQVFEGAVNVLKNVKLIHVEVGFRPMQIGKPLFEDVDAFLTHSGFKIWGFTEIGRLKDFLYRRRLMPNPPWRLNAVYYAEH